MQEDPERARTNPARDPALTRTVHGPWTNEDVGDAMLRPVSEHELILLDLGVAIRLGAALGVRLGRTRLVQKTPLGLVPVRVDREGAAIDESPGDPRARPGLRERG